MAEKAVLVDKLPPVQKAKPAPKPVAPKPVVTEKPAVTTASKPAPAPKPSPKVAAESKTATTAHTAEPQVTITPFESVTYHSFLVDLVIFALAGTFFVGKAFKSRVAVHFNAMIGFGVFLYVLAASFVISKSRFADFLRGEADTYNLLVRGVIWTILAPALFIMLSQLIHVSKKDRPVYILMFVVAAGLFLFIALSNIAGLAQPVALILALGSFTCSAVLIIMLFFTLGSLPDEVPEHLKKGVTLIVLVIACGWFMYPFLNLLSRFVENSSLYPFLLNIVDLATVMLIAYGFYQGAGKKADRIVMKPAFRKAMVAPSTMEVQEVEAADEEEEPVGGASATYGDAPAKPTFRRPAKRMKDGD